MVNLPDAYRDIDIPVNPGRLRDPNPQLRQAQNSRYGMRPLLPLLDIAREIRPLRKMWDFPARHCHQGKTGTCTGQSLKGFEICAPVQQADRGIDSVPTAFDIYDLACARDGYTQNNRDVDPDRMFGTTTDASMKAARELGIIGEWRNAANIEDILDWLAFKSGVILAMDWDDGFFIPDSNGFIIPRGTISSGHQFLTYGYDVTGNEEESYVECANSWGDVWGLQGNFKIKLSILDTFIFSKGGDAIATLEIPSVLPDPEPIPEPIVEPVHGYPFQQWMTIGEYRSSGLFSYVHSSYECHWLLGISTVRGKGTSTNGPVENNLALFNMLDNDGRLLGNPDIIYMIQRVQARHRGLDWLS